MSDSNNPDDGKSTQITLLQAFAKDDAEDLEANLKGLHSQSGYLWALIFLVLAAIWAIIFPTHLQLNQEWALQLRELQPVMIPLLVYLLFIFVRYYSRLSRMRREAESALTELRRVSRA